MSRRFSLQTSSEPFPCCLTLLFCLCQGTCLGDLPETPCGPERSPSPVSLFHRLGVWIRSIWDEEWDNHFGQVWQILAMLKELMTQPFPSQVFTQRK